MDKITHQVRAEHWIRILNECMNVGCQRTPSAGQTGSVLLNNLVTKRREAL